MVFSRTIPRDKIGDTAVQQLLQKQSTLFLITYLTGIFLFSFSSYVSEFIGMESNILSIMARGITVLVFLYYLFFLVIHRLFRPVHFFYLFLLFWLLYSIRIIHDTTLYGWQLGKPASDYYLFGFVLIFFCSIPLFVPVRLDLKKADKIIYIILVGLNVLGIFNNLGAENLFEERLGGNERLNPIVFGMLAGLLVIISFVRVLRFNLGGVAMVFAIATALLGLANLLVAASKSPILFTALSFVIMIIYHIKNRNPKAVLVLVAVITLAAGSVFYFGIQDVLFLAITRFSEIGSDASSYERLDLVLGGLRQFLDEPLFGSFLEERMNKEYPHNLVLEAFMATGIIGGFLFLVLYTSILVATLSNIFKTNLSGIPLIGFCILVVSMFSGGLSFFVDFWLSGAVMLNLFFTLRYKKRVPSQLNI